MFHLYTLFHVLALSLRFENIRSEEVTEDGHCWIHVPLSKENPSAIVPGMGGVGVDCDGVNK